jgi:hypothetical protein
VVAVGSFAVGGAAIAAGIATVHGDGAHRRWRRVRLTF